MNKVIVSIISDQIVPNYIFIKEFAKKNDELLFISSLHMKDKLNTLTEALDGSDFKINSLIFDAAGVEENWNKMCSSIRDYLKKNEEYREYTVNLTGGTKLMSLAVKDVFKGFKSEFYYIPSPKNIALKLDSNENESQELKYRVTVEEYLKASGVKEFKCKEIPQKSEYTFKYYDLFKNFNEGQRSIIDGLRADRKKKKNINLTEINDSKSEDSLKATELNDFLKFISFPFEKEGILTSKEIVYLTGGWFEEYVYFLIKNDLKPKDIVIDTTIKRTDITNQNEIDILFTFGNKLFIIECKTGMPKEGELNAIVHKAVALKDELLGRIGAKSYIFSLEEPDERFTKTAKNMGITYCDKTFFEGDKKQKLMEDFVNQAKDKMPKV